MSELTEDSVRAEVRAWLEANWNPELGLVEWRNKLADSGWGVPTWPKQWYGRDLPQAFQAVVIFTDKTGFSDNVQELVER